MNAHFPLGATFALDLLDSKGSAVPASFSLGVASPGPGEDSDALFHDFVAFEYIVQPCTNAAIFQATHLGTVPLTITPADPTLPVAELTIIVDTPASLGTTHPEVDNLIYPLAQKTGILPQHIKAQIRQESGGSFNPLAYRYEPLAPWVGDYGVISRFGTPLAPNVGDLRAQSPYIDYALATAPDLPEPGGLPAGSLLLPADVAPRSQYLMCCDASANLMPVPASDNPPQFVPMLNILLHNPSQNWKRRIPYSSKR